MSSEAQYAAEIRCVSHGRPWVSESQREAVQGGRIWVLESCGLLWIAVGG